MIRWNARKILVTRRNIKKRGGEEIDVEAKIEGNVEKIDVSQIIATCSLTAT